MTFEPDWITPPGDSISRLLFIKEIEQSELAEELGMDDDDFYLLLSGKVAISPNSAIVLAEHLGSTPAFWLRREKAYRSELKRCAHQNPVEQDSWVKSFPLTDMRRHGIIPKSARGDALIASILSFFGCESFAEWKVLNASGLEHVSFRASSAFESRDSATLAWKRMGEIQADKMQLPCFNREEFERMLPELKRLSHLKSPELLLDKLRQQLSTVGVALTSARALSGCRASGATWMLSGGNPVIHLSFRHLSDDHLWFTIYHEAAHILLGHGEHVGYDKGSSDQRDKNEMEADQLARNLLIPREIWRALVSIKINTSNIRSAARQAGVTPGILVGQLENAGLVAHSKFSFLKRRFFWGEDFTMPLAK